MSANHTMDYYIHRSIEEIQMRLKSDYGEEFVNYLNDQPKSEVIFIASGSSFNAVQCAKDVLGRKLNKKITVFYPYTFALDGLASKDANYILISQSGRSTNTLKAMRVLEENQIPYLFITDNESIQSSKYRHVQYLEVGNEEVPFVTEGFSLTLFLLIQAAYRFSHSEISELSQIPILMKLSVEKAQKFFQANDLGLMSRVHFCGLGSMEGASREAALKCCETLQIAGSAYELEEFMHGGFLELTQNHYVFLLFSHDAKDRIGLLAEYLPDLCGHVHVIGEYLDIDDDLKALCVIPFFQELVYLMNVQKGNPIPLMDPKYVEFEKKLKSKTIGYYE